MEDADKAEPRWRRLHSRIGVLVLASFVALHLLSNATALRGEATYTRFAGAIQRSPIASVLTLAIIAALAIHAGYGIVILRRGADPTAVARHGERRTWLLQRVSAVVLLVFSTVHLWELRLQRTFFGLSASSFYTVLSAHLSWTWGGVPWVALFYLVGIGAAVLHAANGVLAATGGRARVPTAIAAGLLFLIGSLTVVAISTGMVISPPRGGDAPCGPAVPSPTPSR